MIYLRSLRIAGHDKAPDIYPFNLPLIWNLESLAFEAPVTFFVGENGTGKDTLENVTLTRSFLANPAAFLRHL